MYALSYLQTIGLEPAEVQGTLNPFGSAQRLTNGLVSGLDFGIVV